MNGHAINVASWNVHGQNDPDRRAMVFETISDSTCHIVCLQETKLELVDSFIAASIGGMCFQGFAQRPAVGTRGGIIILCDQEVVDLSDIDVRPYSFSAIVTSKQDNDTFKITVVYGPMAYNLKDDFFGELVAQKPPTGTKWLALGDFNQIY